MIVRELVRSLRQVIQRESYSGGTVDWVKHYMGKLGLEARSRIFVWSFQPIKKGLKDMHAFHWADLMRFPTGVLSSRHPRRYLKFIIHFWKYQKNMRSRSWSSLSMIYHRPLVLWYYYTLFWWAEYCGILSDLLGKPDLSLIPELFIRYIVKIDAIIDRKDGREYLLDNLSIIKRNCADVLDEWFVHIQKTENGLSPEKQRHLVDMVWKFRQSSLIASRQAQLHLNMDFNDLLEYKEMTAGDLSRVWVNLLCNVYHPRRRAENSIRILGTVAMAIQIIDDMLDCPVDYRDGVHNIFLCLLGESPNEFNIAKAHFEQFPYNHLDWVWANKHLPTTCRKAVALITRYVEEVSTISEDRPLIRELCEIISDWKLLEPREREKSENVLTAVTGNNRE